VSLSDAVREQLLAIGIDESGPAPPEVVLPESNDITWMAQKNYLEARLDPREEIALTNLLNHPILRENIRFAMNNPQLAAQASQAEEKLELSEGFLNSIIETSWPRP
jgi:hypothetical protein